MRTFSAWGLYFKRVKRKEIRITHQGVLKPKIMQKNWMRRIKNLEAGSKDLEAGSEDVEAGSKDVGASWEKGFCKFFYVFFFAKFGAAGEATKSHKHSEMP